MLICFYVGILYCNQAILTIGYALGMLLLLSVVELVYRCFTIKARVNIPISMAEIGKPVNVVIRIKNKSRLPAGKIAVKVENKNVLETKGKKQWITVEEVGTKVHKHSTKMTFDSAGCHEVLISHMKIYSSFGLIYMKCKCKDFSSVLIMPEVYATNVQISESVRNFLGDADVYDEFRPGHDSGETFEIRPYREKDKLQSIHWKLSTKMDELMVKETSLPKACAVVLMLELKPRVKKTENKKTKKKESYAGAYLELAASISFSLMDQKCPHFVAWYSREKDAIRRIRVDDEESFYIFLDAYLREAYPIEKDIREEYRNDFKSEWYLHDIVINEKLEVYRNGELLTRLDEKKIKDECEKLELLL